MKLPQLRTRLVRSLPRACGLWLAVPLVALAVGCGEPRPDGPNILLVSFDTLRADRLGSYGNTEWGKSPSPHVDALAAAGVQFERCLAPRGQTHPSIASMLTGLFPITHGVRENGLDLPAKHRTFIEDLADAGYRTGVFVANFSHDIPGDAWIYRGAQVAADGFGGRRREEAANESAYQRVWDERTETSALKFLDGWDGTRPFAAWVHFYDLHKPYNPPPKWHGHLPAAPDLPKYLRTPGPGSGQNLGQHLKRITLGDKEAPAQELAAIRALYDTSLAATDDRLGRLLAKLDELGVRDDTLIVFTADHGEELYDHNRYFYHGASIYDSTLHIPLVVAGPGVPAGQRVAAPVQNLDVGPTLLELAGMTPRDGLEGRSLAGLVRGTETAPPRSHSFAEWQDLIYIVSDGRHTFVDNRHHVWPRKPPYYMTPGATGFPIDCFEAYDLRTDPDQQVNLLAGLDPQDVQDNTGVPGEIVALREALQTWLRDPRHREPMRRGVSAERLAELQQLGYIGVSKEREDVYYAEGCEAR